MTGERERLETLISRRLAGALSDEERLELETLLRQSPEAQRLYELDARIADLASEALAATLSDAGTSAKPVAPLVDHGSAGRTGVRDLPPLASANRRFRLMLRWALPAAAAACLAVILVYNAQESSHVPTTPTVAQQDSQTEPHHRASSALVRPSPAAVVPVAHRPNVTDRLIDRDWIGVRGADGNTYWLELDRTRTFKQPGAASNVRLANFDL